MVIYLDMLLLENFIVNLFLIYVTANTVKVKVKFRYMIFAAALGSIYVITLLYPKLKIFSTVPFKMLFGLIIILIAFRNKSFIFNLKALSIFITYSMLLAGICIFIQFNEGDSIWYSAIINFSYKKLMISLMIIYMLFDRIIVYIKDRKNLNILIYNVDIILKGSKKSVKAFLDTGNELREPATNLPVIIVEKSVFCDINLSEFDKFYIPYKVVNGQGGNLQGFKPDFINIREEEKSLDREVIIAICEVKLSDVNDYQALLSRGVMM